MYLYLWCHLNVVHNSLATSLRGLIVLLVIFIGLFVCLSLSLFVCASVSLCLVISQHSPAVRMFMPDSRCNLLLSLSGLSVFHLSVCFYVCLSLPLVCLLCLTSQHVTLSSSASFLSIYLVFFGLVPWLPLCVFVSASCPLAYVPKSAYRRLCWPIALPLCSLIYLYLYLSVYFSVRF